MNQQQQQFIQNEFDQLRWYYKNDFEKWAYISFNENQGSLAFFGGTGGNYHLNTTVIVKQIRINGNHLKILKEIFFLSCLKKNRYFAEILDVFLSNDGQKIYIVLKDEGPNLKDYINFYIKNDKLVSFDFFRHIIFQIACGLKILHDKNLIHSDIKHGNIVVSGTGLTKICDLGNTDKISKLKYAGTNGYLSPQVLLGKEISKEDDMWSLGVVYLELFKKKTGIFSCPLDKKEKIKDCGFKVLKYLLENFYDIKKPNSNWYEENIITNVIINSIKSGEFNMFEYRLKPNLLEVEGLNDDDKEIIKKLLDLNPDKRMNINDLINSPMFQEYNYMFINSDINYREADYERYFGNRNTIENNFNQFLNEIKQKINGLTLFNNNN